jgi:hypothetical protein
MHMKSALKSARLRLFRANCRSDRQPEADALSVTPSSLVGALVAGGEAFDDCHPPSPARLAFRRGDGPG